MSVNNGVEDRLVRCPFYTSLKDKRISCEGITDDCNTILEFQSKLKRDTFKRKFCDNDYEKCEIFKSIWRKYE